MQRLWEAGKIKCPLHLAGGNESQLIEIFKEVRNGDYVFCSHRNHYHAILAGVKKSKLLKEILGKSSGLNKGRARSMCNSDPSIHYYSSAIVGGCSAIAVGVAYALKRKRSTNRVWCFIGDGSVDTGHTYEAISYSEGWDLPITFIVEDNDRSTCTSIQDRLGKGNLHTRNNLLRSHKVLRYFYDPKWPHVGSQVYVSF